MKVLEKIREYRKRKNISQEEMSDMLGMSQNNYGKIERGDTELTVNRLVEIAHILKVPIFELVGENLNDIIELIKQTYETEIKYLKADLAKSNVITNNLLDDLNQYRNILFEKGLIDTNEFNRSTKYILADASVITSEKNINKVEKLLNRE